MARNPVVHRRPAYDARRDTASLWQRYRPMHILQFEPLAAKSRSTIVATIAVTTTTTIAVNITATCIFT